MTEVRFDPRQAPAGAELLLAADFGRQAPGAPDPRPARERGQRRQRPRAEAEDRRRPDAPARGDAARRRAAAGPRRPNGGRTADALLDECGEAQALPREGGGDLARIHSVTPRTRPRSARSSPRPENDRQPLGRALLQPTTSCTLTPDTHGNRPMRTG